MIYIHTPTSWLGRTMKHCTTCKQRRRFIVRLYEWYPSHWICGGCGYTFASGEGRHKDGQAVREKARQCVKDQWKNIDRLSVVAKKAIDIMFQNRNGE